MIFPVHCLERMKIFQSLLSVLIIALIVLPFSMANAAKTESPHIATPADFHPGQAGLRRARKMGKAGSVLVAAFSEFRTHQEHRKKDPKTKTSSRAIRSCNITGDVWRSMCGRPEMLRYC
jgi:hypothetical protein